MQTCSAGLCFFADLAGRNLGPEKMVCANRPPNNKELKWTQPRK